MNSKWRMCHPERNAVRREVEGSRPADVCRTSHERSVVAAITCLFALLFSACTDYQAEFEESFGALEYIGEEYVSSDANHHGGVSGGSDEKTSKSSGSVDPSSATSSATPTSGGTEQPSSGAASSQSSGGQSSNSTGSSGFTESSSSVKKLLSCNESDGNCIKDKRDGQTYKTTDTINGLVWMAENLNYAADASLCYDNTAENCAKYGRLYEIKSYYDSKNLCPEGWRIPDSAAWIALFAPLGGIDLAGPHLRSKTGWREGFPVGTDSINFSALPGGLAASGRTNFTLKASNAFFMTSSKYFVNIFDDAADVSFRNDYTERSFVSVRCVQGTLSSTISVRLPCKISEGNCFKDDRDGQTYRTTDKISNQVWMAENLRYEATGSYLPDTSKKYSELYGRFYTWESAKTACPKGWHLPSKEEFTTLIKYVRRDGGQSLRSKSGWNKECNEGADGYGFAAFPAGHMQTNDNTYFLGAGRGVHFWSTSDYGENAGVLDIECQSDTVGLGEIFKYNAVSVRCIKGEPLSSSSVKSSSSSAPPSSSSFGSSGLYADPRPDAGGQKYKYVRYKGLVWMDQDLVYKGSGVNYQTTSVTTVYSWENAKKACPQNWRLPTIDEFNNSKGLESMNGGIDWSGTWGGYFLISQWHAAGNEGMYWTKSEKNDSVYAVHFNKNRDQGTVVRVDKSIVEQNSGGLTAFAVRCVTESLTEPEQRSSSSSIFISGEEILPDKKTGYSTLYPTVTIGDYKWMAQNLNYFDETVLSSDDARCRNDAYPLNKCGDSLGNYYDFENAYKIASVDKKGDDDKAWTVPSVAEANALLEAVGNEYARLLSPAVNNTNGTNESGFNVLPSGYYKDSQGQYVYIGYPSETCFWLWAEKDNSENADALCFFTNDYRILSRPKSNLYPVRLVRAKR